MNSYQDIKTLPDSLEIFKWEIIAATIVDE